MLEQFFLTLLQRSLAAGVLIVALLLLRPLLFRVSRASCCVLWWLVAFRLLCPFSIPSVFSLFGLFTHPEQTVDVTPSAGDEIYIWNMGTDAVQGGVPEISKPVTLSEIFSVLWLMGAVLLMVFWVVSYLRMRRRSRYSILQDGGYWRCDQVRSPMVFGIIHPRILIPFEIEEADIPYILAHEQSHLARRDHWTKPLAFLLVAVYWFNPIVWLAYVLYCRDIEFACDAKALRMLGENAEVKVQYSRVLLRNSIRPQERPALPFGGPEVKKRLEFALSYRKPKFAAMLLVAVVFAAVAVCFLTDPIVMAAHTAPVEPVSSVNAANVLPSNQPEESSFKMETQANKSDENIMPVPSNRPAPYITWVFSEIADYFIDVEGNDPTYTVNWIFKAVEKHGYTLILDVDPQEYLQKRLGGLQRLLY